MTHDGYLACRGAIQGSVTVDGKRFEVVRSLPGEEVDVQVTDESRLSCSAKCGIRSMVKASDTYPKLPDAHGVKLFPVDGTGLRELLERSMLSISSDESRPNLNGVYFSALKVTEFAWCQPMVIV